MIGIKLFDFAGVWTNSIYSFLGRRKKSLISWPLLGRGLTEAWEMGCVGISDQLQTGDRNKLREEMWWCSALSLYSQSGSVVSVRRWFPCKCNMVLPSSAVRQTQHRPCDSNTALCYHTWKRYIKRLHFLSAALCILGFCGVAWWLLAGPVICLLFIQSKVRLHQWKTPKSGKRHERNYAKKVKTLLFRDSIRGEGLFSEPVIPRQGKVVLPSMK